MEGHEGLVVEGPLPPAARGRHDVHGQGGEHGEGDGEDEEDRGARGAQRAEHAEEGEAVVLVLVMGGGCRSGIVGLGFHLLLPVVVAHTDGAPRHHDHRRRGRRRAVCGVVAVAVGVGMGASDGRVRLRLGVFEEKGARALLGQDGVHCPFGLLLLFIPRLLGLVPATIVVHHVHQRRPFLVALRGGAVGVPRVRVRKRVGVGAGLWRAGQLAGVVPVRTMMDGDRDDLRRGVGAGARARRSGWMMTTTTTHIYRYSHTHTARAAWSRGRERRACRGPG